MEKEKTKYLVTLQDEQRKLLLKELKEFLLNWTDEKRVVDHYIECIYFSTFKNLSKEEDVDVIEITIVKNFVDTSDEYAWGGKNEMYHEKEFIDSFGVQFLFTLSSSEHYFSDDQETVYESRRSLYNSTILYDKTGFFTHLKEKLGEDANNMRLFYPNLSQIEPPILDELRKVIEEKQMEELYLRKSI